MKHILLINPSYRLEIRWVANEEEINVKADYFPLGLGTVAGLTPPEFLVDIWDELVRGPIEKATLERSYDLVGVTSHSANLGRALKIAEHFRAKGQFTVVGGPGVTSNPDRCRGNFDVLFIGEAEFTWPQFLKDWTAGAHRAEYRQIQKPDITLSPAPRWDSIAGDVKRYAMGTVQTTRGCPNDCEYCDVVYLHGRRQRFKSVEQILTEVRALQKLGVSSVSFNDDNFTIHHKRAKEVLRALIPLNNSFPVPLRFMSQLSIDVAGDDELLELLADANFYQVLIGLETPNPDSLREAGKLGNLKGDMVQQVHKVLSYGIVVRAAMIVGFDNDGLDIFDKQYEFMQKCLLPSVSLHMLNAPVGTRLWRRLREEGRVIDAFSIADGSTQRLFNNTIPKSMTRVQLMQGFRRLYERMFTWSGFEERMLGFADLAKRPPRVPRDPETLPELLAIGPGLKLDAESCAAMERIFRYTDQKAPFMLGRVKELVVQFVRYRDSVQSFLPGLDQQIELEASGRLTIKLDQRPVAVPKPFRAVYPQLFTEIHRRVYANLTDKNRTPEALVEIFVDFLVHEEGFQQVEEYHRVLLNELADNICARINGVKPGDFTPVDPAGVDAPDAKKIELHDDVLKSVEQELLRLARAKAAKPCA